MTDDSDTREKERGDDWHLGNHELPQTSVHFQPPLSMCTGCGGKGNI